MERLASADRDRPGFPDLVEMWKSLLDGAWNTLAVVPTDHQVSVQGVVDALELACPKDPGLFLVIDARGQDVTRSKSLSEDVSLAVDDGKRVVVFIDSLMRSLSGAHVVRDVNAVLLVLRVSGLDLGSVTSTLDLIGADRIVGAVSAGNED